MRVLLVLYRFRGLALLVCCASFAPVTSAFPAEPQAIMTVTTSDDELNHDGDCSLREAIQAAHQRAAVDACLPGTGHDVIELAAETYILRRAGRSENAGAVGDLDIAADLTILGAGAATTLIEGGRVDRVLDVLPGGQLTLVGITVRNGEAVDQSGGGIANAGTTTVIASVVEGNVVAGEDSMSASPYPTGGGINNVGTLTVIDSIIRNNAVGLSINFPPDSTANAGGGIASSGALTVIRSTISENSGIHGGGIYSSGTLNLSHSVVRDNAVGTLSGGQGGGIFNRRGGSATIAHSQILHNTTFGRNSTRGGGIANEGEMVVSKSMISANNSRGLMDGGSFGGGILNVAGAVLTLVGSTVHENVASGAYMGSGYGGGIANEGHLIVENSTISGNRTTAGTTMSDGSFSGGIDNYRGRVELFNSTISTNTSAQAQDFKARGAGIGNIEGVVTLHTTIVAGNTDSAGQLDDCMGTLESEGYNLIQSTRGCTITGTTTGNVLNVTAKLRPLQHTGGPTPTHALDAGSPAIDAGSPEACPPTDQRGVRRPRDGNGDGFAVCDIGAYEREGVRLPQQYVPLVTQPAGEALLRAKRTTVSRGQ